MTSKKCIRAATMHVEATTEETDESGDESGGETGDAKAGDDLLVDWGGRSRRRGSVLVNLQTAGKHYESSDSEEEVKTKEELEAEAAAKLEAQYKIEAVVDLHNFFSTFNRKKVRPNW